MNMVTKRDNYILRDLTVAEQKVAATQTHKLQTSRLIKTKLDIQDKKYLVHIDDTIEFL